MTNKEYYGAKMVETIVNNDYCKFFKENLIPCYNFECEPGINCDLCTMMFSYWLTEEHIETKPIAKDTLIEAQYAENGVWFPRYFSHYDNGVPYVYVDGKTSKTTTNTERVCAISEMEDSDV